MKTSNYLKSIALSTLTRMISIDVLMAISVQTLNIDSGWSLEK